MATLWRACAAVFAHPGPGWKPVALGCLDLALTAPEPDPVLRRLRRLARAADLEDLQDEHYRLFSAAGKVGLDLVRHVEPNPVGQAQRLAALAGFYQGFGVDCAQGRPDEAPTLLELAAWVEAKLAWAQDRGLAEEAEVTALALRDLLKDWLAPGLETLQKRLDEEGAWELYRTAVAASLAHAREALERLAPASAAA